MSADKTPGQIAYEKDVRRHPVYDNGTPRVDWECLDKVAKWSWERNPTPRRYAAYTDARNE